MKNHKTLKNQKNPKNMKNIKSRDRASGLRVWAELVGTKEYVFCPPGPSVKGIKPFYTPLSRAVSFSQTLFVRMDVNYFVFGSPRKLVYRETYYSSQVFREAACCRAVTVFYYILLCFVLFPQQGPL